MSYLLGQMEATRIIGEAIHETGKKVLSADPDQGQLLLFLGASFIRAADTMQTRMREQTGRGTADPEQMEGNGND